MEHYTGDMGDKKIAGKYFKKNSCVNVVHGILGR